MAILLFPFIVVRMTVEEIRLTDKSDYSYLYVCSELILFYLKIIFPFIPPIGHRITNTLE